MLKWELNESFSEAYLERSWTTMMELSELTENLKQLTVRVSFVFYFTSFRLAIHFIKLIQVIKLN